MKSSNDPTAALGVENASLKDKMLAEYGKRGGDSHNRR